MAIAIKIVRLRYILSARIQRKACERLDSYNRYFLCKFGSMKKTYLVLIISLLFLGLNSATCQTTWTGPKMTFVKADSADWKLDSNQDQLTDRVHITRGHKQGIFNIVTQTAYDSTSPSDTEWAYGTTADIASLTFDTWIKTNGNKPPSMVNKDAVLHLITDDIYIDIKFLSFSGGANGGGFSYERSTEQNMSLPEFTWSTSLRLFPNPTHDLLYISGMYSAKNYSIYNVQGALIMKGIIGPDQGIEVINLLSGLYFVQLEQGEAIQFIKE